MAHSEPEIMPRSVATSMSVGMCWRGGFCGGWGGDCVGDADGEAGRSVVVDVVGVAAGYGVGG